MSELSDALYAFVPTIEEAHRVAAHIFLTAPSGTTVGFNESKRGEGYIVVDASADIRAEVESVTGVQPLRVITYDEIIALPDLGGIQGERRVD